MPEPATHSVDQPGVELGQDRKLVNIMMPTRDGVPLATDFYFPSGDPPWPSIVARTCYNKANPGNARLAEIWNARGYVLAIQDVRGRGQSEGEFRPFRQEHFDGYDAFEWVAAQPWSDGNIATQGASYSALGAWLTALAKPPHLRGMIISASPSDPFVEFPTCGSPLAMLLWYALTGSKTPPNFGAVNWEEVFRHLPLETMDSAAGLDVPLWHEAMQHTILDEFWEPHRYQNRFHEIDVPVLHISGWYDDELIGTPLNFAGMVAHAPSERARRGQRLLIGPWGHAVNTTSKLGDIEFGPDALIDLQGYMIDWLDSILGRRPPLETPPVRIFVMGANRWRDEQEWPLRRTRFTDYFMRSGGHANSSSGDGALTTEPPVSSEPADTFVYNPADPVPFLFDYSSFQLGGPDNYAEIEQRPDVLCYTTAELTEDCEVTGPIRLTLFASSSAVDTDFAAKLVDVHPDGYCQRLCDGILRARYREGADRAVPMEPRTVYELEIDMWSTSQVFKPGHRIRLEVTSSAFPKYDRNLNCGDDIGSGTRVVTAENRVWHDPEHPSRLVLPIIPGS